MDMATVMRCTPQNYSRDFKGLVSVRSALLLNIPAGAVINEYGVVFNLSSYGN